MKATLLAAAICGLVALCACTDSTTGNGDRYSVPHMTYYAEPDYPFLAHQAGLDGDVTIRVTVLASGEIEHPAIQVSSGVMSLDDAALQAARRCLWQPAMRFARPIEAPAVYVVWFRLT